MLALLRMLDKSSLQDTTLLNSLPGTKLLDSKKLLLLFWSPKIGFRYLRSVFLIFRPKFYLRKKRATNCFQTPDNFGVPAAAYAIPIIMYLCIVDLLAIEGKFQLYMVSLKVVLEWRPFQHEQHYVKNEWLNCRTNSYGPLKLGEPPQFSSLSVCTLQCFFSHHQVWQTYNVQSSSKINCHAW